VSTSLLTRPEVAKRLRVSERTLDRLIDSGQLAKTKVGRSVRISEAALAAYVTGATR
jgi:excisionase family DNA binding protein